MNKRRVLITGGAGFLAGFIVEALHDQCELTLLDRIAPPDSDPRADLSFLQADVNDYDRVKAACAGQDIVIHLIALVRERFGVAADVYSDVMVKGTWHLAQACVEQGVKRLINISSVVAQGWPRPDELPSRPEVGGRFQDDGLFYALAKSLGESIGKAYHEAHGLEVIHLRPGVIAGDGLNQGPKAPEEPDDHWFVYVDPRDVAHAVVQATTAAVSYGTYNIVAGRSDVMFDWSGAATDLGYSPQHNWPEIPAGGGS
ncbi:MAG: NAD(P)-dependent oxidoreductase [Lentisphaeria bacterium]|jgi:NAD+ dependent glucose-6-phosphate dehydrogenase|nr:NAD(P)-dependent oxidoreductase [Lentisphaeria bacterium]